MIKISLKNTIDNNNFNHKNKISKFKFNDINNLINNIKNNTISEANAKKKINELNEIKKVATKGNRLIDIQRTLLNLFDDLNTIFNNNNNNNNNKIVNEDNNVNDNDNKIENEDNNVNDNDNKILNEDNNVNDNDNKIVNEVNNVNDNDDYDSDDDHDEHYYEIRQINISFKKIDETKSFEDQTDVLKITMLT